MNGAKNPNVTFQLNDLHEVRSLHELSLIHI